MKKPEKLAEDRFHIRIKANKPAQERLRILSVWGEYLTAVSGAQNWRIVPEGMISINGVAVWQYRVHISDVCAYKAVGSENQPPLRA